MGTPRAEGLPGPGETGSGQAAGTGLEAGLARSRGGFMSRLRGLVGGSSFSEAEWEIAEEALIAGDVGISLATLLCDWGRKAVLRGLDFLRTSNQQVKRETPPPAP